MRRRPLMVRFRSALYFIEMVSTSPGALVAGATENPEM